MRKITLIAVGLAGTLYTLPAAAEARRRTDVKRAIGGSETKVGGAADWKDPSKAVSKDFKEPPAKSGADIKAPPEAAVKRARPAKK